MRKHYPLNSNGAEDAGQLPWKDGVPQTGVEGSYPGQALFTDTEAEILAAIDGGGFVRNGSDLTQLLQTIARGLWLGQVGGTATALTAALPNNLVVPGLQAGVRVRGIAASNYPGGGGTLAITGVGSAGATVSYPIVGADGATALAAGAWKAGQFLTFDIDASGNARFGGAATGGYVGELTTFTKTARQAMPGAATETDITWNALTTAPSWATVSGGVMTVTQKCRVASFLSVVAAVSNSAAGYSEADIHLALNGTDIEGTGQSAWPNTNTTYLPYLKLTSVLDLNVGDVLKARAVVNSANYNGAYILGTDGAYGITEQSTNWRLLCLSKG